MEIKGLAAIVTGGTYGPRGATAAMLARGGAKVTVFDLNVALGTAHANDIGGHFIKVDVTAEAAVDTALTEAEALHGTARILVSCAGIAPSAKVIDREGAAMPLAAFAKIISINLIGAFNVLSKFAARLHDAEPMGEERGVIINAASVAAFEGQIGQAAYAASKGGVAATVRRLRASLPVTVSA